MWMMAQPWWKLVISYWCSWKRIVSYKYLMLYRNSINVLQNSHAIRVRHECCSRKASIAVCKCVLWRGRSEGGPASSRRNKWAIESWREGCVFGSRTTHVTLPAPLCVSHTAKHDQSYILTTTNFPLLMIHSSVNGIMFPYGTASCNGITGAFIYFNEAAQNMLLSPSFYSQHIEEVIIFVTFSGWHRYLIFH